MNFVFYVYLVIAGLILWPLWYVRILWVTPLASSYQDRRALYVTPPGCLLVLALCLVGKTEAVAGPSGWLSCCIIGAALLAVATWSFPWLGLSARDDVAERRNLPAAWAISGAQVGVALAFGGATGDALASLEGNAPLLGALGVAALFGLWGVLERWAGFSEAITVERDAGAGCRLAALLPALGLLLGRALSGILAPAGLLQFFLLLGGPAVLLLAAVLMERWRRGRARGLRASPKWGDLVIALAYLGGAGLWICWAR
jgi:hypothetical protein